MTLAFSEQEVSRLAALARYDILDTPPDQALDDITLLAAQICGTPMALITFVDGERQWFKSKVGISASETAREIAFCAHAICQPDEIMVVPDARSDVRFANNPLVTGDPHVRFYVGLPLVTSDGYALGTLCVVDRVVRELDAEQMAALRALRRSVMSELELRRLVSELRQRTRDVTESRHTQEMLAGQKQVLEMIASDASLDDILHMLNRIVEAQFPGMLCSVVLLDETGTCIKRGAAASLPEEYNAAIDGYPIGPCVGSCGTAMYKKETVIVRDIATDPKWEPVVALALKHNLRACWSTPILGSTDQVLGAFAMYFSEPREPGQRELDAIATNGALAGIAIEHKRAEENLRQLAVRFQATFDHAAVGIAHVDPVGHVILANRALCEILGYKKEELIGHTVGELSHPDDMETANEPRARLYRGEIDTFTLEKRYLRKDGNVVWVDLTVSLIRAPDGSPLHDIGVFLDITKRKCVEAANAKYALHQSILAEFGQYALGNWTLDDFMEEAASNVALGLDVEYCKVLELVAQEKSLLLRAAVGAGVAPAAGELVELAREPHAAFCLRAKEAVTVEDYREETRFQPSDEYRAMKLASGVAVLIHGRVRAFGVLLAHSPRARKFSTDEVNYVQAIANVLAAAIERKETEQRLATLAQFDPLTELPNRSLFRDRLSQAIARAQREERLLALVFLDLDQFKEINDTLGHEAGDQVLKAVGARLRTCLRDGDTIARLGGDEFTVIVEGMLSVEQIGGVARKLLRAFSTPVQLEDKDFFVTASMGIAIYPVDALDGDTLLKHADVAMYQAKSEGRNNFQYYAAPMSAAVTDRMTLETSLRRGMERNEFVLYYQPVIRLSDGAIVGAEALLRWQHPELGLTLPSEFIQVAEQTGLIVPIGEWVVQTACSESAGWQCAGVQATHVAINLSARQFRRSNLVPVVTRALAQAGLPGDLLQLEITEGLLMENPAASAAVLAELKKLGVHIAVDDFGTGYSSLSYLKHFPLDILKIDQSFVRDLSDDSDVAAIVRAIVGLARSLQLSITGEGVETQAQLAFLRENHCDCAQGYLFSGPVPAQEFSALLARGRLSDVLQRKDR